jgi:polysaccharide export outer membrane protein
MIICLGVKMYSIKRLCLVLALAFIVIADVLAVQTYIQTSPIYTSEEGSDSSIDFAIEDYCIQLGLEPDSLAMNPSPSLLLASSSYDYSITPGDTFSLAYTNGNSLVTLSLACDVNNVITIPSIGKINTAGKTLIAVKSEIEKRVEGFYPYSYPIFSLVSCASFNVRITGLVKASRDVACWGLSKLSDLAIYALPYASTRSVTIISKDGKSTSYDLFDAMQNGSLDPYLKPGDTVQFNRAETFVRIDGAVYAPGLYQVKPGEDVNALIDLYARGAKEFADISKATIKRYEADGTMSLGLAEGSMTLQNMDCIHVPATTASTAFVTIEGALSSESANLSAARTASRVMYSFFPGETIDTLVRNIAGQLTSVSDLSSLYVQRDGQITVFDGESFLNGKSSDFALKSGDKVVIPFIQLFVTVQGGVNVPGTFGYVPGETASYYINLAGSFSQTSLKTYNIYDKQGNKLQDSDPVPAQAVIKVANSTLVRDLGIAASVVALVASVLSIILDGQTIISKL